VHVIDNGIEDEAYMDVNKLASDEIKNQVKSFGNYIIQIGRIYKIKNYETTIRALFLLPKNVNFVIAGPIQENDEYIEKIQALIKSLKLQDRVKFIGVVRGVDKYYLIKHAQMMVHMALWESYCNVVHEGLSQGLVCIVANNTALPYLVRDRVNGYCVKTRDFQRVAERANFVLKNKNSKFIKDMESRNRKFGLENSWENVSAKLGSLYEDLVSRQLSKGLDMIKINYEKN
jgi:glycosyltransferase involved in cell wall biosynthesis